MCPRLCASSIARWCSVAALVIAIVWYVVSCWHSIDWVSAPDRAGSQTWVGSAFGTVYAARVNVSFDIRPVVAAGRAYIVGDYMWWFGLFNNVSAKGVVVPIWVLFVVGSVPTAILWIRHFRGCRPGLCPTCSYPIGVSTTCTECGNKLAADATRLRGT